MHYQCRDGKWLLLSIAADEWRWDKFKSCFDSCSGAPILEEPRFAASPLRDANARELVAILDGLFAQKDLKAWRGILDAAGIIFGIVAETQEVAEDEQVLAAGHLVAFSDADFMTVNSPIEIRGQEKVRPRRAPNVGEHSDAVLRNAGYADAEIAALREARIIA